MPVGPVLLSAVGGARGGVPRNLEGACKALEKEFAQMVFSGMRKAMVPSSSSGSAGFAKQTTEALLDSQWAKLASQGEGLGLWRTMVRQLEARPIKSGGQNADQQERGTPSTAGVGD